MASDDPVERVPAAQAVGEDLASGGQPALGAARDLALAEALTGTSLTLRGRPSGLVETAATKGVLPGAPRPRLPPARAPPR